MLVLGRKNGQRIRLRMGDHFVWITVVDSYKGKVRVGIDAEKDVEVLREELIDDGKNYDVVRSVRGNSDSSTEEKHGELYPIAPTPLG